MKRYGHTFLLVFTLNYLRIFLNHRFAPATDIPGHLALGTVFAHLGAPGHIFNSVFERGVFPAPNSLFYLLSTCIGFVAGSAKAGVVLFSVALLMQPFAVWFLLKAFGRDTRLALLAFPLMLHWPLVEGLIDYGLTMPFVLIAWGICHRRLSQDPSYRHPVLGVVWLAPLIFLGHIQAFLTFGLGWCVLMGLHLWNCVVRKSGYRVWLGHGLTVGLSALVSLGAWLIQTYHALERDVASGEVGRVPFQTKIQLIWEHTYRVSDVPGIEQSARWTLLLLGVIWVLARLVWPVVLYVKKQTKPAKTDVASRYFPELIALVLGAMWALGPMYVGAYWNFYTRIPAYLNLLLIACVAGTGVVFSRKVGWALMVCGTLLMAQHAWGVMQALERWDHYTEGLTHTLAEIPQQGRLAYVVSDTADTGFLPPIWRHLGQYYTTNNQGVTSFSFGVQPGRVVRQKTPHFDFEFLPFSQLDWLREHPEYQYVLVKSGAMSHALWRKRGFEVLGHQGLWWGLKTQK